MFIFNELKSPTLLDPGLNDAEYANRSNNYIIVGDTSMHETEKKLAQCHVKSMYMWNIQLHHMIQFSHSDKLR